MDKKDSCEKDAYVRSFAVLEDNFRQTLFAFFVIHLMVVVLRK